MASEPQIQFRVPFRPRARLLQLLGDQLIGTPRLAVFELVKNAYDADAENVIVTLDGLDGSNPTITIIDDGEGMTLKTIRDIWLVPAHEHRAVQRQKLERTKLNRLPLGEKGVGRFAVHKLGDQIELVTRAKGQPECVVKIDWAALISKPFLSDAKVSVSTRPAQVFKGKTTGTRIVVSELRERSWSRGEVRRLLRQITSISSPFSTRSDTFNAILEVPEHPVWVTGIPDVSSLLNRAPWYFSFSFIDGKFDWKYTFRGIPQIKLESRTLESISQALQIVDERDFDPMGTNQGLKQRAKKVVADAEMTAGIGPIKGEFYVFDRDREVLSRLGDSSLVQSYLDENGGVRVYRDGIRVYNYGEPGDDWLGLDLRRVNTPTRNISRNIIVGAVDLSLEKSAALIEKTNREGFVENGAYTRLRQLVLGALSVLEVERKQDKENIRLITGTGKDPDVDRIKKPLEELRRAAAANRVADQLEPYIRKIESDYDDMRETMLRAGLSGLGLAIVFHEIEHGVRVLHESIEAGQEVTTVRNQARELVRVLDGFSELLRKGDRREYTLEQLIRRVRDINRVRFRSHNVRLVAPNLEVESSKTNAIFAFGLVLGALNNLLDNAFYWLRVRWPEADTKPSPRAIYIGISNDFPDGPAVVIADTGTGFQDEPERLIRPFFSRRPEGMGLGLYYANLVMELSGGRLVFAEGGDVGVPAEFDGAVLALVFTRGKA